MYVKSATDKIAIRHVSNLSLKQTLKSSFIFQVWNAPVKINFRSWYRSAKFTEEIEILRTIIGAKHETITNSGTSFPLQTNEMERICGILSWTRLVFRRKSHYSTPDVQQLLLFLRRIFGKSPSSTNCGTDKFVSFIHRNFERRIFYAFDIRNEMNSARWSQKGTIIIFLIFRRKGKSRCKKFSLIIKVLGSNMKINKPRRYKHFTSLGILNILCRS